MATTQTAWVAASASGLVLVLSRAYWLGGSPLAVVVFSCSFGAFGTTQGRGSAWVTLDRGFTATPTTCNRDRAEWYDAYVLVNDHLAFAHIKLQYQTKRSHRLRMPVL